MSKSMKELVGEARAHVPAVSPVEAHQAGLDGDVLLDVREPGELESEGRIDGALHIPRGILELRACTDADTRDTKLCKAKDGGKVHVICASGARAALAADTLRDMGYDATVVDGGLNAWKSAELPIVK